MRGCSGSPATPPSTSCAGGAGGARLVAEPEDGASSPTHEGAEVAIRRAALRTAMAELAPRERELVALKFFAGLTNAEIASVIGISRDERRHQAAPSHPKAEEGHVF